MADNDETTRKFGDEPAWVKQILTRFEDLRGEVGQLRGEVAQLRESVESRHRETRPMAETLEAIRVDIGQLREGQEELRKRVFSVERKLDVLNNHMLECEANLQIR